MLNRILPLESSLLSAGTPAFFRQTAKLHYLLISSKSHMDLHTFRTYSPGEGNGISLQYSRLENPLDSGAWWATVHGVTESDTLSD